MFTKNLNQLAEEIKTNYQTASPFPHVCIDGLFEESILNAVLEEVERANKDDLDVWVHKNNAKSLKKATCEWEKIGENSVNLYEKLNSPEFIDFLRTISGIHSLEKDTTRGMEGGGISYIGTGGFLDIHADFNYHRKLKKYRRMNLLLYLNKDWKEEYGGSIELWNKSMTACEAKFVTHFNRCVIFNTDDYSYHGHIDRINEPTGRARITVSTYYYSTEKAENMAKDYHSTLYRVVGDT